MMNTSDNFVVFIDTLKVDLSPFMEAHLGQKQMDVLRALKKEFDPHGIMNPGALGLG